MSIFSDVKKAIKSKTKIVKKLHDPKSVKKQGSLLFSDPKKAHKVAWTDFKQGNMAAQKLSVGAGIHNKLADSKVGEMLNIRTTEEKWTSEGQKHTIGAIGSFVSGGPVGVIAYKAGDIVKGYKDRKMAENLADFEEAQARTLSASGEGGFVAAGDIVGAESAVSPAPISPWVLGGGALALVLVALVFARKR